jgi:hypothetical protein
VPRHFPIKNPRTRCFLGIRHPVWPICGIFQDFNGREFVFSCPKLSQPRKSHQFHRSVLFIGIRPGTLERLWIFFMDAGKMPRPQSKGRVNTGQTLVVVVQGTWGVSLKGSGRSISPSGFSTEREMSSPPYLRIERAQQVGGER